MRCCLRVVLCFAFVAAIGGDAAVHAGRAAVKKRPGARVELRKARPTLARRTASAFGSLIAPGNLRASLMGLSDGIASTFGLVAATTAMMSEHGPINSKSVLLAGMAAMISGASSMASGEYSSVSYDNEQTRATGKAEGLPSPRAAAFSSFTSFMLGAAVPMTPIICGMTGFPAVIASGTLSIGTLVIAGRKLARLSGNPTWRSSLRLAIAATFGAAVSAASGALLGEIGIPSQ